MGLICCGTFARGALPRGGFSRWAARRCLQCKITIIASLHAS